MSDSGLQNIDDLPKEQLELQKDNIAKQISEEESKLHDLQKMANTFSFSRALSILLDEYLRKKQNGEELNENESSVLGLYYNHVEAHKNWENQKKSIMDLKGLLTAIEKSLSLNLNTSAFDDYLSQPDQSEEEL